MSHRHKAKEEKTIGYRYPVALPWEQDRRAHGGVCHVETCACGAKRETNSNGRFTERGHWYMPTRGK